MHTSYLLFIMFASTFQRTHWLVPCYLLGQTWRRMSLWRTSTLTSPAPRRFPVSLPVHLESTTCIIRRASATTIKFGENRARQDRPKVWKKIKELPVRCLKGETGETVPPENPSDATKGLEKKCQTGIYKRVGWARTPENSRDAS
jgi:hypothetical protein